MAIRVLTAARSRPSRVAAGNPASSSGDRERAADQVAVRREDRDAEVPGVDVDRYHRVRPQLRQRRGRARGGLPTRVQVPAPGRRIMADVVPDGAGGRLGGDLVPR
jgi:hypothetical protein